MKEKVLIVHHNSKQLALKIADILKTIGVKYFILRREDLLYRCCKGNSLIVVVGGDGTLLRTSHFVLDKTPVLGVNPNPQLKEGFFMCANPSNLKNKIKEFFNKESKIVPLTRLEVSIDGKLVKEPAINEVYIGKEKSYHMSRYTIFNEKQKSSGIIISTAAGSHAWAASAGGKKLPLYSDRFQVVIREPYSGRLNVPKITNKILEPGEIVTVKSETNNVVVIDSTSKEYALSKGSTACISTSSKKLYLVIDECYHDTA